MERSSSSWFHRPIRSVLAHESMLLEQTQVEVTRGLLLLIGAERSAPVVEEVSNGAAVFSKNRGTG